MSRRQIVCGIPTWQEAGRVAHVLRQVDDAVHRWSPDAEVIVVNADNDSPDGTAERFLDTPTRLPKMSLRTGARGKGHNFRRLFTDLRSRGADLLITIDADLDVVPDDWLPGLVEPVLNGGADLVTPLYPRFWYDGNMTNQFMAPLTLAVTGHPIRQPMGGEFAFSAAAVDHLLDLRWPPGAHLFGTDLFCVLRCLKAGLAVEQAPLSTGKIHSWRSDTVDEVEREMQIKFRAMVGTILDELTGNTWPRGSNPGTFPTPPPLGKRPASYPLDHLWDAAHRGVTRHGECAAWRRLAPHLPADADPLPHVDDAAWVRVLTRILRLAEQDGMGDEEYDCLRTLFFVRLTSVLPDLDDEGVEPMVQRLADLLHRRLNETGRDDDRS